MTTPDEPIRIQPAKAPLSDGSSRRRRPKTPTTRRAAPRVIGFSVTMLLLGVFAGYVFLILPGRVDVPAPRAPAHERPQSSPPRAGPGDIVAPFEAADAEQARKQAQAELAEFFELKRQLEEQLNVNAWGAENLDRITARAKAGDQMFVEGRYRESLHEYAAAVGDLATLVGKGAALYGAAIEDGQSALAALDYANAADAFGRALAVRPDDPKATRGLERAAKVPEIVELLRQSDRAVLRGEHAAAHGYLAEVRKLDPAAPGLHERAVAVAAAQATAHRNATLSEGFGALERGEHGQAIAAFRRVLQDDAADADGLAGLQQAEQARHLAEIDRLRSLAEHREAEGRWAEALAAYDAVLGIDPSLLFARNGKARIATRVALADSMRRFIDDPGLLSDDGEFATARDVLAAAAADADAGPRFRTQVDDLRAVVERSSIPVPMIIDSDDETEILIHKVGNIGTFLRHELLLRPGRYTIVGSRDGYRDVRDEVTLEPDSAPVDIRCTEPI